MYIVMKRTDVLRKLFNKHFSYKNIGSKELFKLKNILKEELNSFFNQNHWIKFYNRNNKNDLQFNPDGSIEYAFLRCKGSWFDDREAISFNRDGFIGFAGWADSTNIRPFRRAFFKWLIWLKKEIK